MQKWFVLIPLSSPMYMAAAPRTEWCNLLRTMFPEGDGLFGPFNSRVDATKWLRYFHSREAQAMAYILMLCHTPEVPNRGR